MAIVSTDRALADAREAWEAGFSIVASKLNELLAKHDLSIKAAPPANGWTLRQCRHWFNEGMRRIDVSFPEEFYSPMYGPWSLGFVNCSNNREVLIGSAGLDPDEQLAFTVDFLTGRQWTKSEWENMIVLAVERHAQQWRQWFADHSGNGETKGNHVADVQHEFAVICYAARELAEVLRDSQQPLAVGPVDSMYVAAVHQRAGNLSSLIDFWFTRDPITDLNRPHNKNNVTLYAIYRGRPALMTAALRLWNIYNGTMQPRIKKAYPNRLPKFTFGELVELEQAAAALEKQISGESESKGGLGNDAPETLATDIPSNQGRDIALDDATMAAAKGMAAHLHSLASQNTAVKDVLKWLASESESSAKSVGLRSNEAPASPETVSLPVAPDAEQHWRRVAQAIGDANAADVLAIAQKQGATADEKMAEILRIDARFTGKDSNDWAELLSVTPAAIRQTDTWRSLQAAKNNLL